ncbi:gastrula zinc finger protein XlCGF57.1-like [Cydia strobilella]|uniref:gastrula zinc finger protein XlCGF57.1-like n=1 Tax=Cydia strobilella TaxID=1100964 RepID=UPI0030058513
MDSKICRVCLSRPGDTSLFEKHDGLPYSDKIMRFVKITIRENDGLPSSICLSCIAELSVSYEFVQKCEASDLALKTLKLDSQRESALNIKNEDIKDDPDEPYLNFSFLDDDYDVNWEEPVKKIKDKKGKYVKKRKKGKMEPIQCVTCGQMTTSPSAMEIHMRTHTGDKPYSCITSSCDAKFATKGALKRHCETFHSERERKYTCEHCGSSFFRKNEIITHIRVHTDERPYACPFCSRKFRQIASLIRHKRIHTGEKPFACSICNKKFADRTVARKHLLVHSDEKHYTCHLCHKSMKSNSALKVHMNLHVNKKQNVCNYCGMTFSMKGNLKTHIRRKHSEKSGQCNICSKTFSDLEVHMRKHTGEKPFICHVCQQKFATKRSLTHHLAFRHENAAKFKCSIGECTRTFPTAPMLEFHLLKQHTNHTPYVCQHCSRGFFRMSDLSRHLRVSHMELQLKEDKTILTLNGP